MILLDDLPRIKLLDLEPRFIRREVRVEARRYVRADAVHPDGPFTDEDFEERTGPHTYLINVDTVAEADGVIFLCPKCFTANGGSVGTHSVICWRPHVPQTEDPKPGRWEFQGTGLADLTLVAGSSSVLLQGGCNAHFFVRASEIVMC